MSRFISKAEGWEAAYTAFQNINFAAYDYYTIKQSMIEYLQLYFPESFNDYIESSEFIALLEIFAYLGELAAYRMDMNANENSITYAQRKQSVLRLVKLISYNASRNVAASGMVKITSVTTTERVRDSNDQDISNQTIQWNDTNNPNWKNQFLTVIQRIMQQPFGSVSPNERVQVENMLYELYPLNNQPLPMGVVEYTASASGTSYPMELVSAHLTDTGPIENRPARKSAFNILYSNDGLGDSSNTTGFFIYTKQGTLHRKQNHFDGVIPNQHYTIGASNINNTDVWVNHIDPDTGSTIDDGSGEGIISGEWQPIDLSDAHNVIFNTQSSRNKYEIETLENDDVRIAFGDGEFSDIPSGVFDIWYRTSANEDVFIPQTSIVNKRASFKYVDVNGKTQTFSFTYSLINSIQNGSKSETVDHIRQVAPSTHYSQRRMVNAPDYNTLPLRESSIIKLKSINRTFAGDSAYGVSNSINDASFTYQDVKLFGDDLCIFYKPSTTTSMASTSITPATLITNHIEPMLSTVDMYVDHVLMYGVETYRRSFSLDEYQSLLDTIGGVSYPWPIRAVYVEDGVGPTGLVPPNSWAFVPNTTSIDESTASIIIDLSDDESNYIITTRGQRLVVESPNTRFFHDNSGERVLTFDALSTNTDTVTILKANQSSSGGLLSKNIPLRVAQIERHETGTQLAGLPNYSQVSVVTADTNGDLVPDGLQLSDIINQQLSVNLTTDEEYNQTVTVTPFIIVDGSDVFIDGNASVEAVAQSAIIDSLGGASDTFNVQVDPGFAVVGDTITISRYSQRRDYTIRELVPIIGGYEVRLDDTLESWVESNCVVSVRGGIVDTVRLLTDQSNEQHTVKLVVKDYVYFYRDSTRDPYQLIANTEQNMRLWWIDFQNGGQRYRRLIGRSSLNFLWQHYSSEMNLVDPAPSNIHDMFVITKPYHNQFLRWVNNEITTKPQMPTSTQLRNTYAEILNAKMISDTVIMHHGKIKLVFGSKASPELQAKIKVIRTDNRTLTNNQLKIRIVNVVRQFFNIENWDFGKTFYFSELDTTIKNQLTSLISSCVLVPSSKNHRFGDLYQIYASEDEVLQVDFSVDQIEIVESYNARNIQQIVE